jgi:hypothetical protein
MQKSRERVFAKLKRLGADLTAPAIQNATDGQLLDLAGGLEELHDSKLARFIVSLMHAQK